MTHPLAALIAGVPRYIRDGHDMVKSADGPWLHQIEVLAALEAAPVPDLVAEAGKVLEQLAPYGRNGRGKDHPQSVACRNAADTIRALIALATAQAAQIAGLQTDKEALIAVREMLGGYWNKATARAEAAEAKLAELEAQIAEAENEAHACGAERERWKDRAEAAETALAAERAKVARLVEVLAAIYEITVEPAETDHKNVRSWIEVAARAALSEAEARDE